MADRLRLRGLGRDDWRVLGQAAGLLAATALAFRTVGFARWQAWLGRRLGAGGRPGADAARVARLTAAVARRLPWRPSCLERSLVLWWLLRRRGLDADLRVGVRKPGDHLQAHAWVELGGEVLAGEGAAAAGYAPFARPLEPLRPTAAGGPP